MAIPNNSDKHGAVRREFDLPATDQYGIEGYDLHQEDGEFDLGDSPDYKPNMEIQFGDYVYVLNFDDEEGEYDIDYHENETIDEEVALISECVRDLDDGLVVSESARAARRIGRIKKLLGKFDNEIVRQPRKVIDQIRKILNNRPKTSDEDVGWEIHLSAKKALRTRNYAAFRNKVKELIEDKSIRRAIRNRLERMVARRRPSKKMVKDVHEYAQTLHNYMQELD